MISKLAGGVPVFVYGTLKRGFHNHRYLENQTFLGEGVTFNKFLLYKNFTLPYLSKREGSYEYGHNIKGEVYVVTNLEQINQLEGVPFHYEAHMEQVSMVGADLDVPCRIYLDADPRVDMQLDQVEFTDEWTHEYSENEENEYTYGKTQTT